jgi:hypothetical protein
MDRPRPLIFRIALACGSVAFSVVATLTASLMA